MSLLSHYSMLCRSRLLHILAALADKLFCAHVLFPYAVIGPRA